MWLVEPFARAWGDTVTAPRLHFSGVHERLRTKLLLAVGFAGLAALPVLASDVWHLLTPLMSARAARLRFAFALATGLVVVVVVLLFRDCAAGCLDHSGWAWSPRSSRSSFATAHVAGDGQSTGGAAEMQPSSQKAAVSTFGTTAAPTHFGCFDFARPPRANR